MAAVADKIRQSGIFWIKTASNEDQPSSFVLGVDQGGKIQRQGCSGASNKRTTKMPLKLCGSRNLSNPKNNGKPQVYIQRETFTQEKQILQDNNAITSQSQIISKTNTAQREVSLKDLCSEDKRRIANLVEELARVSEEKEEFVKRLKEEQDNFERKIQQLEEENLVIVEEREDSPGLHQQYRECQELLVLYQQYLYQQQAKLNQSIAQLTQPETRSTVLCSEEAPSRPLTSHVNGPLFDGSYLSLATCGEQQSLEQRPVDEQRKAVQNFRDPSSLSYVFEPSPTDGVIRQRTSVKKVCCHRGEQSRDKRQNAEEHKSDRAQQRRSETPGHHTNNQQQFKRGKIWHSEVTEALTSAVQQQEDWEEKKNHLLLQKMQLMKERERLQAWLAEQEERISRKNQQLQQSCLHRSSVPFELEKESSKTRIEASEPDATSHEDLPQSGYEDAAVCARQSSYAHFKQNTPITLKVNNDSIKQSKLDIGTCPAKPPDSQNKPTSVCCSSQKTSEASVDYSMVELLDIFSPVSEPEQCKPAILRPQTSQLKPTLTAPTLVSQSWLTPGGRFPSSTQQDLEESQILEDIFFIL